MKKLLMVALVLGLVLSMAQVTVAEDRLKLDGSLRVRAINTDNNTGVNDADDNEKWIDSRFRLGMTLTVAEGITANLRADYQDDAVWGLDVNSIGRPEAADRQYASSKTISIDRMFIRIERDMFIYQGGQIFQSFGVPRAASAYQPQNTGMALRLKLPVMVDLNYFKLSENGSKRDELDAEKDADIYGIQGQFASDAFTVGAFYVLQNDQHKSSVAGAKSEDSPTTIGVWGLAKLGPVALKGSLDMFGGSYKVANATGKDEIDYMGTQLWLNGEMGLSKAFKVGANIYYALAANKDGSEVQRTYSTDSRFGGFEPHEAFFGWNDSYSALIGTRNDTPFNPSDGDNAGSVSGDVYVQFQATDSIKLQAQIGYFTPQDEDLTQWENSLLTQAYVDWTFAPKCDLAAGGYYRTDSFKNDVEFKDAEVGMAAVLQIAW